MKTPATPTVRYIRRVGRLLFWVAVCLALGGTWAYLDHYPSVAFLLGLAALLVAEIGVFVGMEELSASRRDI